MNAALALGRLVWRPRALLQLYIGVALVAAAWMLAGWLGGVSGAEGNLLDARRVRLLGLVVPLVLGLLCAAPIAELSHAQFTWHLPRAARHLRGALWGVALCGSLGAAALVRLLGASSAPFVPSLAWALCAFAIGTLAVDWLHPSTLRRRLALLGVPLLVLGSEQLFALGAARPVPASAAGLAAAIWLLSGVVTRETLRGRVLVRTRPSPGLAVMPVGSLDDLVEPERRDRSRAPRLSADGERPWPWVRAALHENFGARPRGAAGVLAWLVVLVPALLCAYEFLLGLINHRPLPGWNWFPATLSDLRGTLVSGGTGAGIASNPDFMIAFHGGLLLLFTGTIAAGALDPGLLQPLSRRQRAEVVWRLHLVVDGWTLVAIGAGPWILGELLDALLEPIQRGPALPGALRPILVLLVLAPIARGVQYTRRGPGPRLNFLAPSLLLIGTTVAWVIAAITLSRTLALHGPELPAPWTIAAAAALALTLQLGLRTRIRSWYSRRDLV